MILGCDAAGVDPDGRPVLVYPVVEDKGDPRGYSLFSERYPGTLAEQVAAPRENLLPIPDGVSFADAACLPTAWLTAYHMLVTRGGSPTRERSWCRARAAGWRRPRWRSAWRSGSGSMPPAVSSGNGTG
ncbi:hypothetical protein Aiant_33870 [Actinoplanes ianthinogenes]|uniref:Uncharacterized protein n=1 Tax=Actinoplanes ianthinogenes TaxID=122358 RepID=A0ABM7LTR8_9ACTN|nr:hypothetical protein Aiant_33870 [Actinoplanes ianthinogenes]